MAGVSINLGESPVHRATRQLNAAGFSSRAGRDNLGAVRKKLRRAGSTTEYQPVLPGSVDRNRLRKSLPEDAREIPSARGNQDSVGIRDIDVLIAYPVHDKG